MKQILSLIILVFIFETPSFTQSIDTIPSTKNTSKIVEKDILLPSLLLGASLISFSDNEILDNNEFKELRNEWMPNFSNHLDNYLQFAPIALVFASDFFGVKSKSTFGNQCYNLVKSEILMEMIVQALKYLSHEQRPDASDYFSFPSGHTAEAFMAATFLHKEFGERSIYYSIAGYSIATTVGLFRMANNKHWASDVMAGAAFGILATNMAYRIFPSKESKNIASRLALEPLYSSKNILLRIHFIF